MEKGYIDFLKKRKEELQVNISLYKKYMDILKLDMKENEDLIFNLTNYLNI